MHALTVVLFVTLVLLLSHLQGPLHAYLDPGTGSIVIQAVLAAVVGALTIVKLYWSRLKGLVRRKPPTDDDVV